MTPEEHAREVMQVSPHKKAAQGIEYYIAIVIRAAVAAEREDNEQVRGMLDEFFHACPIADGKLDADQYGMELFHRLSDWTYQRGEFATRAQTAKDGDAT